ncbi:MAG TPA: hypothetical protein VJ583_07015 [Nitrososphaeraceae archaeon]|nr:hypothetical protein [Nitrososphaeraceae archaeon]
MSNNTCKHIDDIAVIFYRYLPVIKPQCGISNPIFSLLEAFMTLSIVVSILTN